MATRRAILGRIALGLGVVACRSVPAQPAQRAAYVGIETSADTGRSRARFFTASGAPNGVAPLDFRAHGMARHGRRLVVFPRRPGNRFAVVDLPTLRILRTVTAPPERHFYGHGAFTTDGRHLLVTENDLNTLGGGIGVYDTGGTFRRLGRINLPGPGPHEIVREAALDRFHIALGGLETHPAYGRTPLNLARFRSQIVSLDFDRGHVEPLGYWSGTEGVSLRHLAVDGGGRLYVGGQLVDPTRGTKAVLWCCEDGNAVSLDDNRQLAGYVSSVASYGDEALATSKEANAVLRIARGRVVGAVAVDGASAAALGPELTAVSGFESLALNEVTLPVSPRHEFDNHGLVTI